MIASSSSSHLRSGSRFHAIEPAEISKASLQERFRAGASGYI
jgi:hypothetical protein